jgi:hypothetical protein
MHPPAARGEVGEEHQARFGFAVRRCEYNPFLLPRIKLGRLTFRELWYGLNIKMSGRQ